MAYTHAWSAPPPPRQVPPETRPLLLVIRHPLNPSRQQSLPATRPMAILIKKRKRFKVVAKANARHEGEHWILQPIGKVGLVVDLDLVARAVWEEPRSTLGAR